MIYSIQYMRAIAAILVLMHHVAVKSAQNGTDLFGGFSYGGAGVDLFFVISGFIMCHTVANKPFDSYSFILARIKRIIPLYWFMTTLALIVYIVMPEKVNASGGETSIFNSYFLLPLGDKFLIQNGWTLSYEFYFYIVFAAVLSIVRSFLVVSLALVFLSLGSFIFTGGSPLILFLFDTLILEFALGVAAYSIYINISGKRWLGLLLFIASGVVFYIFNFLIITEHRLIHFGFPCFLFFIAMLNFESFFEKFKNLFASKCGVLLGNSSYSLYLVHPFTLVLSTIICARFFQIKQIESAYILVMILSSIFAGCISYLYVEKYLSRIVNRGR